MPVKRRFTSPLAGEVGARSAPGEGALTAIGEELRWCYNRLMSTLEEIEAAISKLAPRELDRFREWFDAFDASRFDARIERDAVSGKLDGLAEAALADYTSSSSPSSA